MTKFTYDEPQFKVIMAQGMDVLTGSGFVEESQNDFNTSTNNTSGLVTDPFDI